jgi:hypothetical protein
MKTTVPTSGVASVHVPCVCQRYVCLITFGWYSGESRRWDSSLTAVTNKDNGLNDWGVYCLAEAKGFYVLTRS